MLRFSQSEVVKSRRVHLISRLRKFYDFVSAAYIASARFSSALETVAGTRSRSSFA